MLEALPVQGGGGGATAPGVPLSGSSHSFLILLSLRGWSLDRERLKGAYFDFVILLQLSRSTSLSKVSVWAHPHTLHLPQSSLVHFLMISAYLHQPLLSLLPLERCGSFFFLLSIS